MCSNLWRCAAMELLRICFLRTNTITYERLYEQRFCTQYKQYEYSHTHTNILQTNAMSKKFLGRKEAHSLECLLVPKYRSMFQLQSVTWPTRMVIFYRSRKISHWNFSTSVIYLFRIVFVKLIIRVDFFPFFLLVIAIWSSLAWKNSFNLNKL